jgi:hypothetical protein
MFLLRIAFFTQSSELSVEVCNWRLKGRQFTAYLLKPLPSTRIKNYYTRAEPQGWTALSQVHIMT